MDESYEANVDREALRAGAVATRKHFRDCIKQLNDALECQVHDMDTGADPDEARKKARMFAEMLQRYGLL